MEDISIEDAIKSSDNVPESRPSSKKKPKKVEDDNDDENCIFGLSCEIIKQMELKKLVLLFIILLIVHSSIYMNRVLTPIEGATIGMSVTSKGSMIQITSVVALFSAMNFLVNMEFL